MKVTWTFYAWGIITAVLILYATIASYPLSMCCSFAAAMVSFWVGYGARNGDFEKRGSR